MTPDVTNVWTLSSADMGDDDLVCLSYVLSLFSNFPFVGCDCNCNSMKGHYKVIFKVRLLILF